MAARRQIPNQSIRDALMNLIVYQGDTEFASVEQQKNCSTPRRRNTTAKRSPGSTVKRCVMAGRCVTCWSTTLAIPANSKHANCSSAALSGGDRLLGSFNAPVNNWLDFFTYTEFVDRDGNIS